jgi:hypothetical protein
MQSRFFAATRHYLVVFLFLGIITFLCDAAPQAWAAPAATTTTLAVTSAGSAVTTVDSGAVVTLTATVKSGTDAVTAGQVTFCDATAKYCTDIHIVGTAQLTKAGKAVFKLRPSVGSHSFKAVFAGTKKDAASTSATAALTVTGLHPAAAAIAQSGGPVTYTLTATVGGSGSKAPTGTVSFLDTSNANAVLGKASLAAGAAGLSFFNPADLAINGETESIVVGDFNGDGIPDLALANFAAPYGTPGNGNVAVFLGNGDGTFTAVAESPATGDSDPVQIVAGDFNGDGILDLAVSNFYVGSVTVLLGNGDGTFTASLSSPQVPGANGMVAADFNGDGILDLAVGDSSNTVTILLGNGDGTFTAAPSSPAAPGSRAIVTGDFNGDGIPDLAVVTGNGELEILLGKGDGSFTLHASYPISQYSSIAVGDFNGDGILDLAFPVDNYPEPELVTVMLGNGDGTFTASKTSAAVGQGPSGIAVGDFNGDGKADLAIANGGEGETQGSVTVMQGKGDGTFTALPVSLYLSVATSIAAADFNGDGVSDLAVPCFVCQGATVLQAENQAATAKASAVTLPVDTGTHQVVAKYSGDTNYGASTSAATGLDTGPATPSVSLTASANPVNFGVQVIFTAKVTGGAGTPTGTVNFLDGTTVLGSGTLNSSGVATYSTAALAVGSHSITASYAGDSNYSAATSAALKLTVNPLLTPSVNLTSSANPVNFGTSVTLTATVAGSGVTPTGAITFLNGATTLGMGTLNASGVATFTTSALPGGSDSLTASYSGDSNYSAATSAALNLTVNPIAPTIGLTASAATVVFGTSVTFAATLAGNGITPTGTVTFLDGAMQLGTGTLGANGMATLTTSTLPGGSDSITASYSGDTNYTAISSSAVSVTVNKATPLVNLVSSARFIADHSPETFTASLTSVAGVVPTGTVAFSCGKTQLGAFPLNASGVASVTTSEFPPGAHGFIATYSGDSNYAPATSAVVDIRVTGNATPTVTLTASASSTFYGAPVTFTATVTGSLGTPSGEVYLYDVLTPHDIVSMSLNSSGVATYTESLIDGTHSFTAMYSGDNNYLTTTSAPVSITVTSP